MAGFKAGKDLKNASKRSQHLAMGQPSAQPPLRNQEQAAAQGDAGDGFRDNQRLGSNPEVTEALREERWLRFRSLKFRVDRCDRVGDVFKLVVDPIGDRSALDEALEGATATWVDPHKGHADILSVLPEDNLLTLRNATSDPPPGGGAIVVRVPDFLGQLLALWQDDALSASCMSWFQGLAGTSTRALALAPGHSAFPQLRRCQRDAFELAAFDKGFLFGPPGTGKTTTLGCLLAAHLTQFPDKRVLLLSSTNSAVDRAILATDDALDAMGRSHTGIDDIRARCKRVGIHFIPSNYVNRQHLLCMRKEPLADLTTLEAERPDSADDDAYSSWRDAIDSLRRRIRERTRQELSSALLHAMTTTRAAFDFEMLRNFAYELIVFDEASQVGLAHALMLAQLGKRVLFVGDPKQLSPIVQANDVVTRKWLGNSIFDHAPSEGPAICMLDEQNRMVDEIGQIVSKVFYDGRLRIAADAMGDAQWVANRRLAALPELADRHIFIRTIRQEATFAAPGWYRIDSMEFICQSVLALVWTTAPDDILVITPFKAQRHLLKRRLRELGLDAVAVSTVHRAQGGERHTVLFDPVHGESPWLNSPEGARLINVAISRAKARLVIAMSRGDRRNVWLDLIAHWADHPVDSPF